MPISVNMTREQIEDAKKVAATRAEYQNRLQAYVNANERLRLAEREIEKEKLAKYITNTCVNGVCPRLNTLTHVDRPSNLKQSTDRVWRPSIQQHEYQLAKAEQMRARLRYEEIFPLGYQG